jgi:hypothetical protein
VEQVGRRTAWMGVPVTCRRGAKKCESERDVGGASVGLQW